MSENSKIERAEILALEAGRETDALIAEHVLGWDVDWRGDVPCRHWSPDGGRTGRWADALEKYSVDLNACHEMELEIKRRHSLLEYLIELKTLCWEVKVEMPLADALTRCRAALLAVLPIEAKGEVVNG